MKLLIVLFFLSTSCASSEWLTDFTKAKQEAVQSKKLILLNFSGSDWCAPCNRMKAEIFEAEAFRSYAATHLVLTNADFPRSKKNQLTKEQLKHNEMLADKYNADGIFPFTVLLDSTGKVLKHWDGYPKESPEAFIEEINKVIHA